MKISRDQAVRLLEEHLQRQRDVIIQKGDRALLPTGSIAVVLHDAQNHRWVLVVKWNDTILENVYFINDTTGDIGGLD